MSQLFTSSGQIIGSSASASVPPMNIQDWFPFGLNSLIRWLHQVGTPLIKVSLLEEEAKFEVEEEGGGRQLGWEISFRSWAWSLLSWNV